MDLANFLAPMAAPGADGGPGLVECVRVLPAAAIGVKETSWPQWLRLVLMAGLAWWNVYVFFPRPPLA